MNSMERLSAEESALCITRMLAARILHLNIPVRLAERTIGIRNGGLRLGLPVPSLFR